MGKSFRFSTDYRLAFLGYTLLFFAITFHYWGQEQIISPYRPFIEIGLPDHINHVNIENHKFADFENSYLPEVTEHFQETRSGWLALWDKQNELGRPLYHFSGFSPAYPLSWIIAQLTSDSWHFITLLSLLTCFLSGIFILLFCREIELTPLGGLIAGISLATSPSFMYWLTFPMFLSIWCWGAGTLWALTRLAKKMDLMAWAMLSFSLYSLLLTAYPQGIVFNVYFFIGYGAYLIYKKQKLGWFEPCCFFALSLSAALLALGLALPLYLDLLNIQLDSARISPDLSFFAATLPTFHSLQDIWRFLTLSTFPELLGNPLSTTYPLSYDGCSITFLALFFIMISFYTSLKKTWGWWLCVFLLCLLTFIPSFHTIAVKHFGFNISRFNPLAVAILPLTVIMAYGIDALTLRSNPKKVSQAVLFSTGLLLLIIGSGLIFAHYQKLPVQHSILFVLFIIIVLLASQYKKTYPVLLLSATILIMGKFSYPLMFHQNLEKIPKTSAFIEKVRTNLAPDSRFARVGLPTYASVLPPNFNAPLKLASIHSYNSLSPIRYQHLIFELGGEVNTYGRWNSNILPDYNSTPFWMSNISLILSATKIKHKNLSYQGENAGVYFYKVTSRMGESIQLIPSKKIFYNSELQINDPRILPYYVSLKQLDQGDRIEFKVRKTSSSILILSQKFYSDWQAQIFHIGHWVPAKTILINGVFQGVWLPENTEKVRLEFKPYVARFAWVSPIFWLFLLTLLILKDGLDRKKSSQDSTSK